jgi:hypothetical protein
MQNITSKTFFVCCVLLPDVDTMTENYKSWVCGGKVLRKLDGTKKAVVSFVLLPHVVTMTENYKSWVCGGKVLRKLDGTKKAVVIFYYESDSTSSGQAFPFPPF